MTQMGHVDLLEGRSQTLGVADTARTLILEMDGEEIERRPLNLLPGSLNLIEL